MLTRVASLILGACTLVGCGQFNLYDVEIVTELVDELGEPVRERAYTLCPEFELEGGEVLVEDCEIGYTDRAGIGTTGAFFQDLKELVDVRASVEVEGEAAEGGITAFDLAPADPGQTVAASAQYTVDRAILPIQVTRFDLVGSVNADREDGIANARDRKH